MESRKSLLSSHCSPKDTSVLGLQPKLLVVTPRRKPAFFSIFVKELEGFVEPVADG